MSGDLVRPAVLRRADRPEALPLRPYRIGPTCKARLDLLGACGGREIEVVVAALVVDQEITNGPTDQVQTMTSAHESLCEWRCLVENRTETVRDHNQPCWYQWRATALTASAPGPADVGPSTSPADWPGR